MRRHAPTITPRTRRNRIIATTAIALVAAGSVLSAPFIANASTDQAAAQRETAALSQQGALDSDHLSFYEDIAAYKAQSAAKTTIASANKVIASATSKVDASALETSVSQLADYRLLSVGRTVALTDATQAAADQTAAAVAAADAAAAAAAEAARVANTPDGARATARQLAATQYGWGDDQFQCLDSLWTKESGWNVNASNGSSGATGIPQALPGSKMASAGSDWATNAATQISWGLGYIAGSYGSPCSAWSHSQSVNWY
ncbi:hypothetical protein [Leifsonia sp. Leaf264]|uniref:aggregation-promoting factor C-terminal-like domain-containing protein n=1 Tax=Leifsonia sp. Leaf264 TaxID=1736314 RepID=UPI0007023451|nr:hypothetical protein [Leifsonia sp. Leaf264]KQO96657.1 hypothetical protein ASF30_16230 [Leifsonia sp. Leaf264]